jgi:DNA polymerase V
MKETGQDFDFNSYVVEHPSSSYLIKFTKHHMETAGIVPGDLLVIDKSLPYRVGDIVLAQADQETCL